MNRITSTLLFILVFVSCSKENLAILKAQDVKDLSCSNENVDTCFSSYGSPASFSRFKLLGNDTNENLSAIEKIVQKYNLVIDQKTSRSISFSSDSFYFEFFISEANDEFVIRAQRVKKNSLSFMDENPNKLTEQIKFDFFQKNY